VIWKRALLVTVLVLTGILIETSVLGEATLVGTKPQLILLFTVALAMGEGPALGAVFGFAGGLATDLLTGLPVGLSSIAYAAVGHAVGSVRPLLTAPTAWLPVAMELVATLAGVLLYGGLALLVGQESVGGAALLVHAALAACYNALLTPFLYPAVRALGARLRPVRVIR
jgi:rod shape-determining protein MreD